MPHDCANPTFRFRSSSLSLVQATSIPPTGSQQGSPSSSRDEYISSVCIANVLIIFDALTWNRRPGAWDVEPPASKSGPCSTTTMSRHPIRVR